MPLYFLTGKDHALVKELLDAHRSGNIRFKSPKATRRERDDTQSPDVYIAKLSGSGIPALAAGTPEGTPDVPGKADCDIYQINDDDELVQAPSSFSREVYNLSVSVLSKPYVLIHRDKYGDWCVSDVSEAIQWAKAQSDWTESGYAIPGNVPMVTCKKTVMGGGAVTGDNFLVYLPRNRGGVTHAADPCIYEEDVLGWQYDENGGRICITPYLHMGKIKDIKIQGADSIVPTGWHECDGTSQTGQAGTFSLVDFATADGIFNTAAMPRHRSSAEAVGSNNASHTFDALGVPNGRILLPNEGLAYDNSGDFFNVGVGGYKTATVIFIQRYK